MNKDWIEQLPHISCHHATRLISESMDRRLSPREILMLKIHLLVCDLCQKFEQNIQDLRKILRNYTPTHEQSLPETWKLQLKDKLKER
jgi:hypothetical protein